MVPLAKFDISLKNTPPGLAPFCTESWQKFPPIFFSISLAPKNIVVRVHTKNCGKTGKTKGIYRKTRKPLRRREECLCTANTCYETNISRSSKEDIIQFKDVRKVNYIFKQVGVSTKVGV